MAIGTPFLSLFILKHMDLTIEVFSGWVVGGGITQLQYLFMTVHVY